MATNKTKATNNRKAELQPPSKTLISSKANAPGTGVSMSNVSKTGLSSEQNLGTNQNLNDDNLRGLQRNPGGAGSISSNNAAKKPTPGRGRKKKIKDDDLDDIGNDWDNDVNDDSDSGWSGGRRSTKGYSSDEDDDYGDSYYNRYGGRGSDDDDPYESFRRG